MIQDDLLATPKELMGASNSATPPRLLVGRLIDIRPVRNENRAAPPNTAEESLVEATLAM